MKKYAAFVVFCFALAPLHAQVSVVGATILSANTSYNVGTSSNSQVFNSDAGSTIYIDVPWSLSSPVPFTQHRIYRVNSTWKLDKVFIGANGPTITPLYAKAGTDPTPPCDWGNGLLLTGTCIGQSSQPTQATTITSNYMVIPQLSSSAISSLSSPPKGALIFDTTNNCLRLYNGTEWKCLVAQ
ncbi:hypothetical protein [Runella limosa]|uniref:hypothetical protein n=1 Tax=Runella limosa TaxID=370978 RepID=UPI00048DD8FD|nr:hypothetical protein [Runella limosa]